MKKKLVLNSSVYFVCSSRWKTLSLFCWFRMVEMVLCCDQLSAEIQIRVHAEEILLWAAFSSQKESFVRPSKCSKAKIFINMPDSFIYMCVNTSTLDSPNYNESLRRLNILSWADEIAELFKALNFHCKYNGHFCGWLCPPKVISHIQVSSIDPVYPNVKIPLNCCHLRSLCISISVIVLHPHNELCTYVNHLYIYSQLYKN